MRCLLKNFIPTSVQSLGFTLGVSCPVRSFPINGEAILSKSGADCFAGKPFSGNDVFSS